MTMGRGRDDALRRYRDPSSRATSLPGKSAVNAADQGVQGAAYGMAWRECRRRVEVANDSTRMAIFGVFFFLSFYFFFSCFTFFFFFPLLFFFCFFFFFFFFFFAPFFSLIFFLYFFFRLFFFVVFFFLVCFLSLFFFILPSIFFVFRFIF